MGLRKCIPNIYSGLLFHKRCCRAPEAPEKEKKEVYGRPCSYIRFVMICRANILHYKLKLGKQVNNLGSQPWLTEDRQ